MIQHIDDAKCVGCGVCVQKCPLDTIRLNEQGKAYIAYPDDTLTEGMPVVRYDENSFGGAVSGGEGYVDEGSVDESYADEDTVAEDAAVDDAGADVPVADAAVEG